VEQVGGPCAVPCGRRWGGVPGPTDKRQAAGNSPAVEIAGSTWCTRTGEWGADRWALLQCGMAGSNLIFKLV
jgi:hypothetical protein